MTEKMQRMISATTRGTNLLVCLHKLGSDINGQTQKDCYRELEFVGQTIETATDAFDSFRSNPAHLAYIDGCMYVMKSIDGNDVQSFEVVFNAEEPEQCFLSSFVLLH